MDELVLQGTPADFDAALRRAARIVQALFVVPATLVLWFVGAWWWLPVPGAASFALYELLFWMRGDAPATLVLSPTELHLTDRFRRQAIRIPWSDVDVATVTWTTRNGADEAVVLLADKRGPRLAIRLSVDARNQPGPYDVNADRVDVLLGTLGTVMRAVAPSDRTSRQRFDGRQALEWIRIHVDTAAWQRAGLRIWRGAAPPLDPFGFHLDEPVGWLVLEGERFRSEPSDVLGEGSLGAIAFASGVRPAELSEQAGSTQLPLLGFALRPDVGPVRHVWVPALHAAKQAPAAPVRETDLHTHPGEAAALLAHLARIAGGALPSSLRGGTADGALERAEASQAAPGAVP